jgi:hypothetical protein
MKNDVERPHWLVFANEAPEGDDWFRLMIENPLNGQVSTICPRLIDLDPPAKKEEVTAPPPPAV